MRGNHLFGIFSPEKLKKVIPRHRPPGFQGGAQMRGNQKLIKGDSPTPGSRIQGGAPASGLLFELLRAENAEKVIPLHLALPYESFF